MSNLIVIGITGHNGVGKDVVAPTLSLLGSFFRIGLADGVRSSLSDLDGPTWQFRKESDGPTGLTARRSMQLIGTECRDDIGSPNVWIDTLLLKIRYAHVYHSHPRDRFVISDIRYQHEVDRISEVVGNWGGKFELWRLRRNGYGPQSSHSSETGISKLNPVNEEIENNHDRLALIQTVCDLIDVREWD